MRFPVLIVSLLMSSFFAKAQDSWIIALNGKLVLNSHESNETVNSRLIKSSEWKKNGYLEVNYRETTASTWKHSLQFADETGVNLLVKEGVMSAKITTSTLRKLFRGRKQLKIYIVIAPSNPMIGAPARLIHLGTLKLP